MLNQRTTEKILGVLYLAFMSSSIAGFTMLEAQLGPGDYLLTLYENRSQVSLAVLLHLVNDAAVVAIGILMFNLFRKASGLVATTVLVTRIMESTILMLGKVGVMLLLTVSKEYIQSGGSAAYFVTLGTLFKQWNGWSFEMAMLTLGVGGFVLCYFLLTRKLVPVALASLGMVGYVLLFAKSVMALAGYPAPFYLFVPVAIFEITFPFWLIFKGFRSIDELQSART